MFVSGEMGQSAAPSSEFSGKGCDAVPQTGCTGGAAWGVWPGRGPCGADGAASPVLQRRGRTPRNTHSAKAAHVDQPGQRATRTRSDAHAG
jgi:hypothetical protein